MKDLVVTISADGAALGKQDLLAAIEILDEVREVLRRRAETCIANLRNEIAIQGDTSASDAGELKVRLSFRPGGQGEALLAAARALRIDLSRWLIAHRQDDSTPGSHA